MYEDCINCPLFIFENCAKEQIFYISHNIEITLPDETSSV